MIVGFFFLGGGVESVRLNAEIIYCQSDLIHKHYTLEGK